MKKPSGKLAALTASQNRLTSLITETNKVDSIKIEMKKFKRLLDELEEECQALDPKSIEDKDSLTRWCRENIDPKVEFWKQLESRLLDAEVDACDSTSNVSRVSRGSRSSVASARVQAQIKMKELELELAFKKRLNDIENDLTKTREAAKALEEKKQVLEIEEKIEKEKMKVAEFIRLEEEVPDNAEINSCNLTVRRHEEKPDERVDMKDVLCKMLGVQLQSALPKRDLTPFYGDLLEYRVFIQAFQFQIEKKTVDERERLGFLLQFTKGEAHDLIKPCVHLPPSQGYVEARKLLHQEYGNRFRIASAHKLELEQWPVMKTDPESMKKFSALLQKCRIALTELGMLGYLGDQGSLVQLMTKLPSQCQTVWRRRVLVIEREETREATFEDFARTVKAISDEWNHPVFGIKADSSKTHLNQGQNERFKRNFSLATSSFSPSNAEETSHCLFCPQKHDMNDCEAGLSLPIHERREKLRGRCFRCLKIGHWARTCNQRLVCHKCGYGHPTILHRENETNPKDQTSPKEDHVYDANVRGVQVEGRNTVRGSGPAIAVALVPVRIRVSGSQKEITTYAAQDPYSTDTFIREDLAKALGANRKPAQISLTTMEKKNSKWLTSIVNGLEVMDMEGASIIQLPPTYTHSDLPVGPEDIPTKNTILSWPHLQNIPIHYTNDAVGILIGMNAPSALRPLEVIAGRDHEPYAVRTKLGWSVHGPLGTKQGATRVNRIKVNETEIHEMLENMYRHEFPDAVGGNFVGRSLEDKAWIEHVEKNHSLKEGHYQISLPFKSPKPTLPNNKVQAIKRAQHLKKKFETNPQMKKDYIVSMTGMFNKGHVEKAPTSSHVEGQVFYIPHHGVYHPHKGQKIRVVFDCSATFMNTSLNTVLLQGPDLTNTLLGVLLRFRQETVALVGDIEAMYYQVQVPEDDRNYLRFLWWPNGDTSKPLEEYRLTVHLFGATSSPSCANFALRKTVFDNQDEFDVSVKNTVLRNFYVDDLLKSVPTVDDALQMQREIVRLCAKGGFRLSKFISNNQDVLDSIDENEKSSIALNLNLTKDDVVDRALGVKWDIPLDSFGFTIPPISKVTTRRAILSLINSIYDPMGMASPAILPIRLAFRELCSTKEMSWDDQIPKEWSLPLEGLIDELRLLNTLRVPRCYKPESFGLVKSCQLHHFSDASEKGYASVSYIRVENRNGEVAVAFVCGKSRVAPIKSISIPRLELAAAVLSTKQETLIKSELEYSLDKSVFWTDSSTVLQYIANKNRRFHTFVANRIAMIHEISDKNQWRHVPSLENPADDGSRGMSVSKLLADSKWLKGPKFLWQPESEWPIPFVLPELAEDDEALKKCVKVRALNLPSDTFMENVAKHYSSLSKLRNVIRTVMKAVNKMRRNETLNVSNESVERYIYGCVQREHFQTEISDIKAKRSVKRSSPLAKTSPSFVNGLIRSRGRLRNATVTDDFKFPIILPKQSRVTELVIHETHQNCGHLGREYMLSSLRQNLWILGASVLVRKEISKCVTCKKVKSQVMNQVMADLPEDRVSSCFPFENVGVDYFGPLLVKRGRSQEKRYGVIFTCLATRAVHFEVAHLMDSASFISALRRLMARRGQVKTIRSDNGTNFHGANKELQRELEILKNDGLEPTLEKRGITWKFNPPGASHHGGVWERCIRTARQILAAMLKDLPHALNDESLNTLLCEVEGIMNNRPLTTSSEDPDDLEALTPNHLLRLRGGELHLLQNYNAATKFVRSRWKQVQALADQFWLRWKKDYLSNLRSRQKWTAERKNLKVDDLVLTVDNNLPRNKWMMGRILECRTSPDGMVRSAKIRTAHGTIDRPITKLCLIMEKEND